jgi:hypothetical protein
MGGCPMKPHPIPQEAPRHGKIRLAEIHSFPYFIATDVHWQPGFTGFSPPSATISGTRRSMISLERYPLTLKTDPVQDRFGPAVSDP